MKLNKAILIMAIVFATTVAYPQTNANWVFPQMAILNLNTGTVTELPFEKMVIFTCSVSDNQGELLFYSGFQNRAYHIFSANGEEIYKIDTDIMYENIAVKKANKANSYYIFILHGDINNIHCIIIEMQKPMIKWK